MYMYIYIYINIHIDKHTDHEKLTRRAEISSIVTFEPYIESRVSHMTWFVTHITADTQRDMSSIMTSEPSCVPHTMNSS